MASRRLGVSEARRLLPELVRTIAEQGGRVDITYRGEPKVTMLRISDVRSKRPHASEHGLPPALRVDLCVPPEDLVRVVRELRERHGFPRTDWLEPSRPKAPRPPSPGGRRKKVRGAGKKVRRRGGAA